MDFPDYGSSIIQQPPIVVKQFRNKLFSIAQTLTLTAF